MFRALLPLSVHLQLPALPTFPWVYSVFLHHYYIAFILSSLRFLSSTDSMHLSGVACKTVAASRCSQLQLPHCLTGRRPSLGSRGGRQLKHPKEHSLEMPEKNKKNNAILMTTGSDNRRPICCCLQCTEGELRKQKHHNHEGWKSGLAVRVPHT